MINAKDLEKLSPEERLKKLKEMELAQKKDAQEIGHLIEKSMREVKEQKESTERLAERIAPPIKRPDISHLFDEDGGRSAPRKKIEQDESRSSYFAKDQIAQDYTSLKKMLGYELMPGGLGRDAEREIKDIEYRMTKASYSIKSDSEEIGAVVSASKEALSRIRKYAGIDNNNRPF